MGFLSKRLGAILAVILVSAFSSGSAGAQEDNLVKAVLELRGSFLYAGQPLLVRLSLGNEGDSTISNPFKAPLLKGFVVLNENGDTLKPTGKPRAEEPSRPGKLNPMSFYGMLVDLAEMYPELGKPGRYSIYWEGDGIRSQAYDVNIIPEYDPSKTYQATIDTEIGRIVIDFFPSEAPIAVKAFIDMANSGFYDGLLFSEVHPDDFIVAGDPTVGDNGRRRPVTFPAEPTKLPMVAGTVILKPVIASPPGNSSIFMILLAPKPKLLGHATAFGQVIRGLDVVRKISERPSESVPGNAKFRPIKDIPIRSIKITERSEP